MPALIHCPSCRGALQVPENLAGTPVRCPKCNGTFTATIPAPTAMPPRQSNEQFQASPRPSATVPGPEAPWTGTNWAGGSVGVGPLRVLKGGTTAIFAMVLLGATALNDLTSSGIGVLVFAHNSKLTDAEIANEERDPSVPDILDCCTHGMGLMLLVGTAIPFCMWVYQTNVNLRQMNVMGLEYTPGWAVGWFLIPIVQYFRPYGVLQELWKASDPSPPDDSAGGWKKSNSSPAVVGWCVCWAISGIIGFISMRATFSGKPTLASLQARVVANLISDLFWVGAAIFLILVIKQIRDRQVAKYEALLAAGKLQPF